MLPTNVMSFVKRVVGGKVEEKDASKNLDEKPPKPPPSPNLSHLTPDEIAILQKVFEKQEAFEREEDKRLKKLQTDLKVVKGPVQPQSAKARFRQIVQNTCRVCFKSRVSEGICRPCYDCKRKVCQRCGSFSQPIWDPVRNKSIRGLWKCNMCKLKTDVLSRGESISSDTKEKTGAEETAPPSRETESDWGDLADSRKNLKLTDGSKQITPNARSEPELTHFKSVRRHSASHAQRAIMRRILSEVSKNFQDDDEIEMDDEHFMLLRERCWKERQNKARRRSKSSRQKSQESQEEIFNKKRKHYINGSESSSSEDTYEEDHGDSRESSDVNMDSDDDIMDSDREEKRSQQAKSREFGRRHSLYANVRFGGGNDPTFGPLDHIPSLPRTSFALSEILRTQPRESLDDGEPLNPREMRMRRNEEKFYKELLRKHMMHTQKKKADRRSSTPLAVERMVLKSAFSRIEAAAPKQPEAEIEETTSGNFLEVEDDSMLADIHRRHSWSPDRENITQLPSRDSLTVAADERRRRSLQSERAITERVSNESVAASKRNSIQTGPAAAGYLTARRMSRIGIADCDNIRIIIDDVDSGIRRGFRFFKEGQREVTLKREKNDKSYRTNGFGMHVVGGKIGPDGKLGAYVVRIVPGGPADVNGIRQGDKIIEWDGCSLVDKTFEEARTIMDQCIEETVRFLMEQKKQEPKEKSAEIKAREMMKAIRARALRRGSLPVSSSGGVAPLIAIRKKVIPPAHIAQPSSQDTPTKSIPPSVLSPNMRSPTRRKLPKTPQEVTKATDRLSGEMQVQLWYDQDTSNLVVTVIQAKELEKRDNGEVPQPYTKIKLLPPLQEKGYFKTTFTEPTCNPEWNESFVFHNIAAGEVRQRSLQVTVWDHFRNKDNQFLGEALIELSHVDLDDKPDWYKLQEHNPHALITSPMSPRSGTRTVTSPTSGVVVPAMPAHDLALELLKKTAALVNSDSCERKKPVVRRQSSAGAIMVKSSSVDAGTDLLHPEYDLKDKDSLIKRLRKSSAPAIFKRKDSTSDSSRRSSVSLGRSDSLSGDPDFSDHNCPMFKVGQTSSESERDISYKSPVVGEKKRFKEIVKSALKLREKRSASVGSVTFPKQEPVYPGARSHSVNYVGEEANKLSALVQDYGDSMKNREFLAPPSPRVRMRSDSITPTPSFEPANDPAPEPDREAWSAARPSEEPAKEIEEITPNNPLGPGQIIPKCSTEKEVEGDIKLGFLMTKGQLQVEVICAQGLALSSLGNAPDTYVKTYLTEGEKRMQKRKTQIVRQMRDPQFKQVLKYSACDVMGRTLQIMIWEKQKGFEHNRCLGEVRVGLDKLELNKHTVGWYKLFQVSTGDTDSERSP